MTIDLTYFEGAIAIPQLNDAAVASDANLFVAEYTEKFFRDLFGDEFYKKYTDGLAANNAKYVAIRDGKDYVNRNQQNKSWKGLKRKLGALDKYISPIADFVFVWYKRTNVTFSTGTGEKTLGAANAEQASANLKIAKAWNRMADMNWELVDFLLSNEIDYPEFKTYYDQRCNRALANMLSKMNIMF